MPVGRGMLDAGLRLFSPEIAPWCNQEEQMPGYMEQGGLGADSAPIVPAIPSSTSACLSSVSICGIFISLQKNILGLACYPCLLLKT